MEMLVVSSLLELKKSFLIVRSLLEDVGHHVDSNVHFFPPVKKGPRFFFSGSFRQREWPPNTDVKKGANVYFDSTFFFFSLFKFKNTGGAEYFELPRKSGQTGQTTRFLCLFFLTKYFCVLFTYINLYI